MSKQKITGRVLPVITMRIKMLMKKLYTGDNLTTNRRYVRELIGVNSKLFYSLMHTYGFCFEIPDDETKRHIKLLADMKEFIFCEDADRRS